MLLPFEFWPWDHYNVLHMQRHNSCCAMYELGDYHFIWGGGGNDISTQYKLRSKGKWTPGISTTVVLVTLTAFKQIRWGVVKVRFCITCYPINHCTYIECRSEYEPTIRTAYPAPTFELWGVFREDLRENELCCVCLQCKRQIYL